MHCAADFLPLTFLFRGFPWREILLTVPMPRIQTASVKENDRSSWPANLQETTCTHTVGVPLCVASLSNQRPIFESVYVFPKSKITKENSQPGGKLLPGFENF